MLGRAVRGSEHRPGLVTRRDRGEHHHLARRRGEAGESRRVDGLQPRGDGQRAVERHVAGALRGPERGRQLDERERVARGGVEQLRPHRGRQILAAQHRDRRLAVERAEPALRQPGRRELVAGGGEQCDPLRLEPAGCEGQRRGRRGVEPVEVVHEDERRAGLGQQPEHAGAEQERLGRRALRHPERPLERRGLRPGQRGGPVEHRSEQLMQAGERQLGLRLRAGGPQDTEPVGRGRGVREQRGLAHPGGTGEQERTAAPVACPVEQRGDGGLLGPAPVQLHAPIVSHAGARGKGAGTSAH